ncbi:hypothetical protein OEA41_003481 [Lepraria neglecta]|uniref:AA9 family lytic polysaccharide monooxygenase n=1 Tax=Lepraria neglecta TaxID=209136 RepID=A0AAD9Z7U5_9LECA|nr:hypothetical protein OEA41_003481 [Lepraria neglecta]
MIMVQPPPYGSPNNSPLDAQGANFPCKATSNSGGTVTTMPIGSKQTLKFQGGAVHGGGSCQVSLTTDNPATKNSKWMVIHSIVGGCPARGSSGNNGDNAQAIDPDTYDYTIPQGITPGAYTLAWTWFNKVGNREMYMNCANVKITGGSSKRDTYLNGTEEHDLPELTGRATPNFPAMFIANIPSTDCVSPDSKNLLFPDPGPSVESAAASPQAPSNVPVAPSGPKCGSAVAAAAAPTGSASSGSSGSSDAASPAASPAVSAASGGASAPAASAASPAASPASSAALPDSETAPAAGASPAASAPTAAPSAPNAAAAPAAAAPSTAPSASGNSSGGSASGSTAPAAGSSTGTCTQPGQSICSPDGMQIGTCTMQNTVTWIPVAAGTKCSGGLMVASKRSAKFAEKYMRRAFVDLF